MGILRHLIDNDDLDDDLDSDNSMVTKMVSPSYSTGKNASSSYDRSACLCHSAYDCAPGLILSDSEESSFASCGTEEFFDFEEISSTLNLIENWQKLHRRVRFGSMHVQEYAITVGDHPICRDGLALSLDWSHAKEKVYDIDDYEFSRQRENKRKGIRRRRRVSRLDYWQRREILNRVGAYSNADLSRIERQRNQEAVSEFLQDAGSKNDFGPSLEQEEQGVELEQVYDMRGVDSSSSFETDGAVGWQMNVQILE